MKKTKNSGKILNIKLPSHLTSDLKFVMRGSDLTREEWILDALSSAIAYSKYDIYRRTNRYFISGRISAEEYKSIIGHPPRSDVVHEKRMAKLVGKRTIAHFQKQINIQQRMINQSTKDGKNTKNLTQATNAKILK